MKFTKPALLLVCLLTWAPTPARAQDVSTDEATTRELYNLAEEQAMLARSIQRLRQTMDVLAARLEAEGRTRAVELLREGLAVIDKRAEETAAMTLDERMEAAREELSRGQWESSLARQQEVIADLESLLEVLLDRQDLDKLEERLEELQATKQALDALQTQETDLRKDTQSALDKAIEAALGTWQAQLDELSAQQESTLQDTEREARATDALERERIADGLKQLATSESQLGELLKNWEPNQGAQSQASLDRLGEVAKASQRSAEAAEVAAALEAAAQALENDAPVESVAQSLAGLRSETGQEWLDAAQAALTESTPRPNQVAELRALAREAADQAKQQLERAAALAEEAAQAQAAASESAAKPDSAQADPGDMQAAQDQAKAAANQASAAAQSAPAEERQQAAEAMQAAAEALNEAARRTLRDGQVAQRNAEFLPRAVAGAQAENQRDAGDLRDALERLADAREAEGATEEAASLREAKAQLEAAIDAMQASERAAEDLAAGQEQASSDELKPGGTQSSSTTDQASTAEREALRSAAAEAAETARERLDEAQAAIQEAAQATRTDVSQDLEAMQRALAEKATELKQTLEQRQAGGSEANPSSGEQQSGQQQSGQQQSGQQQSGEQQSGEQQSGQQQSGEQQSGEQPQTSPPGQEAMERAQAAMERAAEALEQGQTAEAADAQREALESLDQAGREARESVRDQSATAEQLAARQQTIEEQLLKLAERLKQEEREDAAKAIEEAQKTAQEASKALQEGDLSKAEEKQREVESQLQEAEDELSAEEEKYQQLRAEEVLIQITQEIQAMQATHKAQLVEVEEIETARGGAAASRSQKVRLRRIAREEETLAQKAIELTAALSGEGSIVFASAMDEIRDDLERAAVALGADSPQGGYDSGWRTQSLMQDADRLLAWLFQALTDEAKRRQEEEQKPESNQEEQSQPESESGESENRLVPSQAELRLLRSMEVDVQSSLQQTLEAFPELAELDPADVDPLILEDIMRLAERHNRITKLFTQVAAALGVPGMEADSQ